jgi:hypothetical protein
MNPNTTYQILPVGTSTQDGDLYYSRTLERWIPAALGKVFSAQSVMRPVALPRWRSLAEVKPTEEKEDGDRVLITDGKTMCSAPWDNITDVATHWLPLRELLTLPGLEGKAGIETPPEQPEEREKCSVCGGDGKETCSNPDHNFIDEVGGELSRLGCPVCGHHPQYKVPGGGECDHCKGTGTEPPLQSIAAPSVLDSPVPPYQPQEHAAGVQVRTAETDPAVRDTIVQCPECSLQFLTGAQMRLHRELDHKPDPYAELKAAHAAGKTIQIDCAFAGWNDLGSPEWDLPPARYRIKPEPPQPEVPIAKPEPEWLPLGPEDCPPGSVMRTKLDSPGTWNQIIHTSPDGITPACGDFISFESLVEDFEISRDGGRTWNPCRKPAAPPAEKPDATEALRREFEAWADREGYNLGWLVDVDGVHSYGDDVTCVAWAGFQAGRGGRKV